MNEKILIGNIYTDPMGDGTETHDLYLVLDDLSLMVIVTRPDVTMAFPIDVYLRFRPGARAAIVEAIRTRLS